jgi:hypothetical protein
MLERAGSTSWRKDCVRGFITFDWVGRRCGRAFTVRSLLIGYFEGINGERGIAWRVADSLALRRFLGIGLDERTPDLSTISRTPRLIDIDTHREVFS